MTPQERIEAGLLSAVGLTQILEHAEALTNGHMIAQEREPTEETEPAPFPYSYEDALTLFGEEAWVGVFERYGGLVGKSPLNWICAYGMLAARCGRSLCFQHAYPHYGMDYALLLMRSGGGKSTAMRLAKTALGGHAVHFLDGIQSPQALAEGLARIEWGKKGIPVVREAYHSLVWEPEFIRLLQQADMKGSNMVQELCRAYDAEPTYTIRRVNKNGGSLTISAHQLSILGATSDTAFRQKLSDAYLFSGLVSRFLIFLVDGLPKSVKAPVFPWSTLAKFEDTLPSLAWKIGTEDDDIEAFYTPAAWRIYESYHALTAHLGDETHALYLWFNRLQAHFHRITLLLTYYEQQVKIPEEYAAAACAACLLWVTSVLRLTTGVPDLPDASSSHQEKKWARQWVTQYLRDGAISPRILQSRCLKLKNGSEKWPIVKEEIERQKRNGVLREYKKDRVAMLRRM